MILGYEASTPDPPNPGQVIDSDNEMETAEKLLEDYYKSNIDLNHPNLQMIREIFKEEHKDLRASIYLFKKSNFPYLPTNYLFIT